MSNSNASWTDQARGSLKRDYSGARAIGNLILNPECETLAALTSIGVSPATVNELVYGGVNNEGQSPFALSRGVIFERVLLENEAGKLVDLYATQFGWGPQERRTLNLDKYRSGSRAPNAAPQVVERENALVLRETESTLLRKLRGDPTAPNLLVHPLMTVTLDGITWLVEPDYLWASDSDLFYAPGEIKSYTFRRGKTSTSSVESACRQAAVEMLALYQFLDRQGIQAPQARILPVADLILKAPGGMKPVLKRQTIERDLVVIRNLLRGLVARMKEVRKRFQGGKTVMDKTVLVQLGTSLRDDCRQFCGLYSQCRKNARANGDPRYLGAQATEALVPTVGSVTRLFDLHQGFGAPPRTEEERAMLRQFRSVLRAMKAVA